MVSKLSEDVKAITQRYVSQGWDYTIELDLRQENSLTIRYFSPTGKGGPGSGECVTLKITTPNGTNQWLSEIFENLAQGAHGISTKLNDSQLSQTSLNLDSNL